MADKAVLGTLAPAADHPRPQADLSGLEQLLESRQLLETVLNHVEADIYMKDAQGRYEYVNQGVLDTFQMTREQVIGHTDNELFPDPVARAFKEVDDRVFATGSMKDRRC